MQELSGTEDTNEARPSEDKRTNNARMNSQRWRHNAQGLQGSVPDEFSERGSRHRNMPSILTQMPSPTDNHWQMKDSFL